MEEQNAQAQAREQLDAIPSTSHNDQNKRHLYWVRAVLFIVLTVVAPLAYSIINRLNAEAEAFDNISNAIESEIPDLKIILVTDRPVRGGEVVLTK